MHPPSCRTWPVSTPALGALKPGAADGLSAIPHAATAYEGLMRAGSVLCVDDNPLNTLLMQEFFRMRGYAPIRVAGSIREAIAMAEGEPPQVVLLDLNLSDGSGLEVLARLRANPSTCHVRVAIVSGSAEESERASASALGAQAWWPKPLDLSTLEERLRRLF